MAGMRLVWQPYVRGYSGVKLPVNPNLPALPRSNQNYHLLSCYSRRAHRSEEFIQNRCITQKTDKLWVQGKTVFSALFHMTLVIWAAFRNKSL